MAFEKMWRNWISVKLSDNIFLLTAVRIRAWMYKSVGKYHRYLVQGPYLSLSQHIPRDLHCELECQKIKTNVNVLHLLSLPSSCLSCMFSQHFFLTLSHAHILTHPALFPLTLPLPASLPLTSYHSLQRSLDCTGSWAQLTMANGCIAVAVGGSCSLLPSRCPKGLQRPAACTQPLFLLCCWDKEGCIPLGRSPGEGMFQGPCCALQCCDTAHSPAEKQHYRHEERLCWTCFR